MKVGWLGVGTMGVPMVLRLVGAGHDVCAYTRAGRSVQELNAAGVRMCAVPVDVSAHELVITMLPRPDDVEQVYLSADGLLARSRAGTLLMDMSTSSPSLAARLAQIAPEGVVVLDAPVSGGERGARDGQLSIMVGGDAAGLARVADVLACLGSVTHVGPAGAGQTAKLVNQILIAAVTLATCEAFALSAETGLDLSAVRAAVLGGTAGSRLFENIWTKLDDQDMSPGFRVDYLAKDLGLVLDEASRYGLQLPGTEIVYALAGRIGDDNASALGTQSLLRFVQRAD